MQYQFLVDTYSTERVKALSVWSMYWDADLPVRPYPTEASSVATPKTTSGAAVPG